MADIGEVPKEWEVVRLGDIVEINRESKYLKREVPDGKFLYIDIESVEGGTGIIKTTKEILGKDAPSRARRVVHQNDVLMSTVRPYLKAFALVPKDYNNQICSTGFAVLSCKNEILPHYLIYTLFSKIVIDQCNKMMMGGQYPALNQSQVAKIEIPIPPLPEQRRIAEVLGTVDSAIQKVGGAIERTERLKRGLMQRLLSEGIGHENFKFNKELGCKIPQEWEYGKLVEFSKTKDNPVQTGPFGAQLHAFDYVDKGVPLILIKNVLDGQIIDKGMPRITETKANELARYRLKPGDIVFSRVGSVGRTAVINKYQSGWLVSGQMLRVRLENPELNNDFLGYLIGTNWFKKALAVGATRKSINTEILSNLPLIVPPLAEQCRIAEILSTVDKKLELEQRRKDKLERVKKGLMNDLLTGNKRIIHENR